MKQSSTIQFNLMLTLHILIPAICPQMSIKHLSFYVEVDLPVLLISVCTSKKCKFL